MHYHTAIILVFRLFLRPSKTDLFNKYPFPVITRNLIYIRRLNHRLLDRCVLRHTSNMNFQSWVILGSRGSMIFFQIHVYIFSQFIQSRIISRHDIFHHLNWRKCTSPKLPWSTKQASPMSKWMELSCGSCQLLHGHLGSVNLLQGSKNNEKHCFLK